MNITDEIRNHFLIFDGAMGTMLQNRGLDAGELPELLNLTDSDTVLSIHKEYVKAGCDVVTANTFGANGLKLTGDYTPEMVITKGIELAKRSGAKYAALDIGPTGQLLEPVGTLTFDAAYELFKRQIAAGSKAGADLVLIETMSDLYEAKAAVLAAKENCTLPVFVTMTFSDDGRTFMGADPKTAALTLQALGADVIGINCSLGPKDMLFLLEDFVKYSKAPLMVQANAGLPQIVEGRTVFTVKSDEYADYITQMAALGVSVIGGCCGTTPEYIRKIKEALKGKKPVRRDVKPVTAVTSGQQTVVIDQGTAIIGERINPTGKKLLKEALRTRNYEYIINEALNQQSSGADILDVNAGLPEIDETETLTEMVKKIQGITPLPLQIDSSDEKAVEAAVRIYNGKPVINSVNGKQESLEKILPVVKKYGAAVVALTLDENGIPETAEGRYKIAKKILKAALKMGIPKEDLIIDCLVLTASAQQAQVMETLKAIKLVKSGLGLKTVLGVSNVSFGLPNRELLNSTFLAAAFGAGLDLPILNPLSSAYMDIVSAFKALNNEDGDSVKYIEKYTNLQKTPEQKTEQAEDLKDIILKGQKGQAAKATEALLRDMQPVEIIDQYFIPSLNLVGERFEKGEIFLPQLIQSAEAVKCGFDLLKNQVENKAESKGKIILATVKGDIHDIGKNIVKMLLQNYGYDIIDLGKDVDPRLVVATAKKENVRLIGLSALMTTTVKYMEETISALRISGVDCKVMVGGAVLTHEYAKMVGADYYAKDARESVKIAAEFFQN